MSLEYLMDNVEDDLLPDVFDGPLVQIEDHEERYTLKKNVSSSRSKKSHVDLNWKIEKLMNRDEFEVSSTDTGGEPPRVLNAEEDPIYYGHDGVYLSERTSNRTVVNPAETGSDGTPYWGRDGRSLRDQNVSVGVTDPSYMITRLTSEQVFDMEAASRNEYSGYDVNLYDDIDRTYFGADGEPAGPSSDNWPYDEFPEDPFYPMFGPMKDPYLTELNTPLTGKYPTRHGIEGMSFKEERWLMANHVRSNLDERLPTIERKRREPTIPRRPVDAFLGTQLPYGFGYWFKKMVIDKVFVLKRSSQEEGNIRWFGRTLYEKGLVYIESLDVVEMEEGPVCDPQPDPQPDPPQADGEPDGEPDGEEHSDAFISSDRNEDENQHDLEEPVPQIEAAVKPKKPSPISCKIAIIGLFFALLYTVLITILVYLAFYKKTPTTCTSHVCAEAATFLAHRIKRDLDPCQDFYTHACGRFDETNTNEVFDISGLQTAFGATKKNMKKALLNKKRLTKPEAIVKLLFDKCMNFQNFRDGRQEVLDAIAKIGKWPMLDAKWHRFDFDWGSFMSGMRRHGMIDFGIFNLSFEPVNRNKTNFILNRTPMTAMVKDIDKVFKYLIGKDVNETLIAEDMKNLEKLYADFKRSSDIAFNYVSNVHKEYYKTWKDLTWSFKDETFWRGFMDGFVPDEFNGKMNWSDRVQLVPVFYHGNFENILLAALRNDRALANFFIYEFVVQHLRFMGADVQNVLSEVKMTNKELYKKCEDDVYHSMTVNFGMVYNNHFVKRENVKSILNMTDEMKKEFIRLVDEVPVWMDNQTKSDVKLKIEKMNIEVAYPKQFDNVTVLEERYKKLHVDKNDTYFKNMMNTAKWRLEIEGELLAKNATFWFERLGTFTTTNHNQANGLYVGSPYVQMPFYDYEAPKYYNYGQLGLIIGHQMGLGFDVYGKHWNAYAELQTVFSAHSADHFWHYSNCFREHYQAFPGFNSTKFRGKLTENEVVAEYMGMVIMYEMAKKLENPPLLPGFQDYDHLQMFFYSYASTYCNGNMSQDKYNIADNTTLGMDKLRVNGVVSNFKGFGEAFGCERGSPMFPEKQCKFLKLEPHEVITSAPPPQRSGQATLNSFLVNIILYTYIYMNV